jgi:hypothetical protein
VFPLPLTVLRLVRGLGLGAGGGLPWRASGVADRVWAGQAAVAGGPQAASQRLSHARWRCHGRSDGRQASLYRTAVASCVGTLEEAAEALTCEALHCQGSNPGMALIQTAVTRLMQTPNSGEISKLMSGFLGYDPVPDWTVCLRTSAPAHKHPVRVHSRVRLRMVGGWLVSCGLWRVPGFHAEGFPGRMGARLGR